MNDYPLDHNIKLSAEEADLQRRRAHGECIPNEVFERAKARTLLAHFQIHRKTPPQDTLDFIKQWLG